MPADRQHVPAKPPRFVLRDDWARDALHQARRSLHPDDPFLQALQRQSQDADAQGKSGLGAQDALMRAASREAGKPESGARIRRTGAP